MERAEITFSEKFCRDVVENTLESLLFFHIHLNKFSNLVSKFLLSCDDRGEYNSDIALPMEYIFVSEDHA